MRGRKKKNIEKVLEPVQELLGDAYHGSYFCSCSPVSVSMLLMDCSVRVGWSV